MQEKILVSNIQRFSLHDGPGIRSTVFLKGCTITCPWCSNPENIQYKIQKCRDENNCLVVYGQWMTCEEIYTEVMKDSLFYGKYFHDKSRKDLSTEDTEVVLGGVTFSGGEPLLQIEKLRKLINMLQQAEIHIAVETSLFVHESKVKYAMECVDLFYVDIKILSDNICKNVLQGNLNEYLNNLFLLLENDVFIIFRIPVIGGYTDNAENQARIKKLIQECYNKRNKPLKIELIKEHNLGIAKYKTLNMTVPNYLGVSDQIMETYKKELEETGAIVEICKI